MLSMLSIPDPRFPILTPPPSYHCSGGRGDSGLRSPKEGAEWFGGCGLKSPQGVVQTCFKKGVVYRFFSPPNSDSKVFSSRNWDPTYMTPLQFRDLKGLISSWRLKTNKWCFSFFTLSWLKKILGWLLCSRWVLENKPLQVCLVIFFTVTFFCMLKPLIVKSPLKALVQLSNCHHDQLISSS